MSNLADADGAFQAKRAWLQDLLGIALPGPNGAAPTAGLAALQARQKQLIAAIKAAAPGAVADPGLRQRLRDATLRLSEAEGLLRQGDAAQVGDLLDAAEALLGRPGGAAGGAVTGLSLVKLGVARIQWIGVRRQAVSDMQRLRVAIAEEFADDDEQQAALGAALAQLDVLTGQLDEVLADQLDAVLNEADAARRVALAATAKATMTRFAALVDGDRIMAALDGNEVLPDLRVTGPLKQQLGAIAAALG